MFRRIFEKAIRKRVNRHLKTITILISAVFVIQIVQGVLIYKVLNQPSDDVLQLSPEINLPEPRILGAKTVRTVDVEEYFPEEDSNQKYQNFSDIPETHPAYNAVIFLKSKEIISSNETNTFNPDKEITRAEAVSMVVKAAEINTDSSHPNLFKDIHENDWYYQEISSAHFHGLISGSPDGNFYPNSTIKQAEFLKFTISAFNLNVSKYDQKFGEWYDPYLNLAIDKGFISQKTPNESISRADAAEIIYIILSSQ